jgi:hypothetical protein
MSSGIDRLFGARGEQPTRSHAADIMHFKNTPSFIEIPFIWLNNLKKFLSSGNQFPFHLK